MLLTHLFALTLFYSWQPVKISMIISENLIKPYLSVQISFYLCLFVKIFLYLCFFGVIVFEMHFLREQFWSAPMIWGSNFEVHPCSEMHFWGSNYFNFLIHGCWLVWLLVILLTLNKSKNLIVILLTSNKSQTSSSKSKFARISSKPC